MSKQISESNRMRFYIENTKRFPPSIKVEAFWFIKAQGKTAGMSQEREREKQGRRREEGEGDGGRAHSV